MSATESALITRGLRTIRSAGRFRKTSSVNSKEPRSKYSVGVSTTYREVEALRPFWRKWSQSPESDIDYYLYNVKNDPKTICPFVITVSSGGVTQAALIGQVKRRKISTVVSFVNIPGPDVKMLEVNACARIGSPLPVIDRLLASHLVQCIKRREVDFLCFQRLPVQSELFRQLSHLRSLRAIKRVPHLFYYSSLSLTREDLKKPYVFSGKIARELRRKTRILERKFPGKVRVQCFSKTSELDVGLRETMRVAVTTWQYYLRLGITDNFQTRKTMRFLADHGWLRIYILYINDNPCAFLSGQLYNKTFYCQYAGYHPEFARYSVGSVLTAQVFQNLASGGVERIDLGEGGQEHNRRLGCQMSEEATVHVYSPSIRGLWLNVFFGAAHAARASGRIARSHLRLNRAGRYWRQYLFSNWRSANSQSGLARQESLKAPEHNQNLI